MPELEKKCSKEMPIGSAVAACRFPFPDKAANKVVGEGLDTVWIYKDSDSSHLTNGVSNSKSH
jgi:hypothetical protein